MRYLTAPAQRRWLQFGLRSFFIVVTVFGVWLGYHVNWLQQRRAFLERKNVAVSFAPVRRPPAWGLWILGEPGATGVFLQYPGWIGAKWSEADEAQKVLASELYPEASIETWGGTIMPLGHPGWHSSP
jgi:hypothetical protein